MRFADTGITLVILCAATLAGCAAPAPRPTDAPAPIGPAAAIDPAVVRQYERALAAMKAKRDPQAERMLLEIAERQPALAGPQVNLGILYQRSGRTADAERVLRQAIAINPKRADAHNQLGIALREQGRFKEARAAYEGALALDASYALAHLNLGILYDLYLLEPGKALQHYERYQQLLLTPDEEVAKWVVDLQRRTQRAQAAAGR